MKYPEDMSLLIRFLQHHERVFREFPELIDLTNPLVVTRVHTWATDDLNQNFTLAELGELTISLELFSGTLPLAIGLLREHVTSHAASAG